MESQNQKKKKKKLRDGSLKAAELVTFLLRSLRLFIASLKLALHVSNLL